MSLKSLEKISSCRLFLKLILIIGLLNLSGCALFGGDDHDPFEPLNRVTYGLNKVIDTVLITPISKIYHAIVPRPVDKAITNFFGNIGDVVVVANDILQFKFAQAASDSARVLANSTLGFAGFMDVSTGMGLPKHNEDFGQTLGAWGFGSGPYVVLPLLGPSSLRDTVGIVGDVFVDPIYYIEDNVLRNGLLGLKFVDIKADFLSASKILAQAALDEYSYSRDAYLQRRRSLVYDGNPPLLTQGI